MPDIERRLCMLISVMIAMLGGPALCLGQWIHYPTAGVPRKADGKPDLTALAPRLPDGKPDFSGIWHTAVINQCVPETGLFCGQEIGGSPLALNIGREFPAGLPYQPWAAELVKQRFSKDDPHVRCLPDNPPRTWVMPHLTKAVHTPRLLVLLYEVNAMYRQIFLDRRPFPADMNPAWNGYSVGHWEGDALVVETRGFRDNLWIDMNGSPMSDAAKMTEKFHRKNFGTMDVEVTIDDPKVYTKPFTVTLNESLEPDTELVDEFCAEGEKDYDRLQRSRGK